MEGVIFDNNTQDPYFFSLRFSLHNVSYTNLTSKPILDILIREMRGRNAPPDSALESPGAYVLVLRVPREITVNVGSLGSISFHPGTYIYIGSAKKSLKSRVRRYLKPIPKKHWHIDYLLENPHVMLISIILVPLGKEVELAEALHRISLGCIEGFGASDSPLRSHLLLIDNL